MEVEAQEPTDPHLTATLEGMRAAGVKIIYGRWLIEGAPNVLLFDTGSQYSRLDEWKADLWNLAGIPTPPNDHRMNETIVFGYIVAWFLSKVRLFSLIGSCISPLSLFHLHPGIYRLRTTHSDLPCPIVRDRPDALALTPPIFENGDGVLLNAHSRRPHNGKRIIRSPRFILHDPTGPRMWDALLALRR